VKCFQQPSRYEHSEAFRMVVLQVAIAIAAERILKTYSAFVKASAPGMYDEG
jgi:hypothetical protein